MITAQRYFVHYVGEPVWNATIQFCIKQKSNMFDLIQSCSIKQIIFVCLILSIKIFITLSLIYILLLLVLPPLILIILEVFYVQIIIVINTPTIYNMIFFILYVLLGGFFIMLLRNTTFLILFWFKQTFFWIGEKNFLYTYKKDIKVILILGFFFLLPIILKIIYSCIPWVTYLDIMLWAFILILRFGYWYVIHKYQKKIIYPFNQYPPFYYFNPNKDTITFKGTFFYIIPPMEAELILKQVTKEKYTCTFYLTVENKHVKEFTYRLPYEIPISCLEDSNAYQELYQWCYIKDKEYGALSPDISEEELKYLAYECNLWGFLDTIHKNRRSIRSQKIMKMIEHQEASYYFFQKGCPKHFTVYHKYKIYIWLYIFKIFERN